MANIDTSDFWGKFEKLSPEDKSEIIGMTKKLRSMEPAMRGGIGWEAAVMLYQIACWDILNNTCLGQEIKTDGENAHPERT